MPDKHRPVYLKMRPLQNSPKSPKFPPRHLGDFGEFCKGLNMPVKVLGRAYYDIPGITDQNTLAEF